MTTAAPTLTLARQFFDEVYSEALPLLEAHRQEIATWQDIYLSVDVGMYHDAEDAGGLRVFTARVDSKLIGYAVFFVRLNPHYMDSLQAVQDVLYVTPEHRRGSVGMRLIKFCESQLARDGVQAVFHHVKLEHPILGKLLERLGYDAHETIYGKRLDG